MRNFAPALLLVVAALPRLAFAGAEVKATELRVDNKARVVMARGAFETTGMHNKWVHPYFQIRGHDGKALIKADKKPVLVKWGEIYTPSDYRATWLDCKLDIPFAKIEEATNLPKSRASTLRVIFDLWSAKESKWIAAGHGVQATLLVAVDDAGKITAAEAFSVQPMAVASCDWGRKRDAVACTLGVKHLKLAARTSLYRSIGGKHDVMDLFYAGSQPGTLGELEGLERGAFFEPITTDAQARELALLAHSEALIIPDAAAYAACLKTLKDKKWGGAIKRTANPPSYGVKVRRIHGVGWRVQLLLQEIVSYNRKGQGAVLWVDYCIDGKGRLRRDNYTYIDTGADTLLENVPGAKQWPRVPRWVTPSAKVVKVAIGQGEGAGSVLPFDRWPDEWKPKG